MIGVCVVLLDELRGPARTARPAAAARLAWSTLGVGWVVLYLGTVVTGSGPHSGDLDSRRNGLDPPGDVPRARRLRLRPRRPHGRPAGRRRRGGHQWLARVTGARARRRAAPGSCSASCSTSPTCPSRLVGLHMLGAALLSAGLARLGLAVLPTPRRTRRGRLQHAAARRHPPRLRPLLGAGGSAEQRVERDRDEQQREVEVGRVEQAHRVDLVERVEALRTRPTCGAPPPGRPRRARRRRTG